MNILKLIELNRNAYISRVDGLSGNYDSHSLAIFILETLDFWIAVDPPPASRGRWVGFNLKTELNGSGREPNPLIIPPMSSMTATYVKVNEKESWTGKWKVESSSQGAGIWAMKQEDKIVESTKDSAYDFKGKVQGNLLKAKMHADGIYYPLTLKMPSDCMSFKGTVDFVGRTYHLKGRRLE